MIYICAFMHITITSTCSCMGSSRLSWISSLTLNTHYEYFCLWHWHIKLVAHNAGKFLSSQQFRGECFSAAEDKAESVTHSVRWSTAAIPRRVTIALVLNRKFNGDLAHSPFNFRPYFIRDISVHAAGQIYPTVPYRMNFEDAAYIRPFVDMYEALGMANSERSMDITLDQFQDGWTFFVVPLTSTLDDSCGFELLRSRTTSVRLQFNSAIPANGVEMIVLGEFDQLIMIDYNRHIVSDSKIA
uniref:Uncharacterized protein n=1 Tax=Globodera rostochiensis TaxID=31243 RepID=A0A914GRS3_GLORO